MTVRKRPPPGAATAETAHVRVYSALRESLMSGDFVPGQRLVVRELAEQYQTSPMPVREALRQLVSDSALYDHPNRGVIVPETSVEIITDLTRVRCTVEGAAADWAAATITEDELAHIRSINDEMLKSVETARSADYLALNREFHFSLYRTARSTVLMPTIERLWLRAGPWLNIMREGATLGLGMDHHEEILLALDKGDAQRARKALVADISDAADIMLRAASSHTATAETAARTKAGKQARSA